ncbi:hypothetical protein ACI2K4_17580 [Micromonospora sp. NPDC050397]|uniref:hypothetical protein n=1 Tax=Micromonospora sp. NPDC050397 TaxID=3364279 RepID=UPI00384D7657
MTEAVHTVRKTKTQIMADVQAAVDASPLATVVVANPWGILDQKNLVTQAGHNAWAPILMGPGAQGAPLTNQLKLALDVSLRNKTDQEIYAALAEVYVRTGNERLLAAAKRPAVGTCLDICCLLVALLGGRFRELFNPTSTIEVVLMTTVGQAPHAFVVVDRLPTSTLSNHTTWGPDAFVIDQWYALQRNSAPGSQAVKDLDPNGDRHDADFISFLTGSRLAKPATLARKGVFTARDFIS